MRLADDGSNLWKANWATLKQGFVPWEQVIADLKAVGNDGYLSVEDFTAGQGSVDIMRQFVSYIGSKQ